MKDASAMFAVWVIGVVGSAALYLWAAWEYVG